MIPADLLDWVKLIERATTAENEVQLRQVIGRAYYVVFLELRELACSLVPALSRPLSTTGAHGTLDQIFSRGRMPVEQLKKSCKYREELAVLRRRADYELAYEPTKKNAKEAVNRAVHVVATVASLDRTETRELTDFLRLEAQSPGLRR